MTQFFELVLRVTVSDDEPDPVVAAVDAMHFVRRHLINQDKRLREGFGVQIVGSQAKRTSGQACFGCPYAIGVSADESAVA